MHNQSSVHIMASMHIGPKYNIFEERRIKLLLIQLTLLVARIHTGMDQASQIMARMHDGITKVWQIVISGHNQRSLANDCQAAY